MTSSLLTAVILYAQVKLICQTISNRTVTRQPIHNMHQYETFIDISFWFVLVCRAPPRPSPGSIQYDDTDVELHQMMPSLHGDADSGKSSDQVLQVCSLLASVTAKQCFLCVFLNSNVVLWQEILYIVTSLMYAPRVLFSCFFLQICSFILFLYIVGQLPSLAN